MKKISAAVLAAFFGVLAGCAPVPVSRPVATQPRARIEAPPCVPEAGLKPGSSYAPAFDAARTSAISALLSKISVCEPLPYDHDGIIFSNREGRLPPMPHGHYKEYTLVIPGRKEGDAPVPVEVGTSTFTTGEIFSGRGPERLVIGGGREIYYTPDHYISFVQIRIVP